MLTLQGVTARIGSRVLFKDFSLTVQARDRLGLVGPNGVGKSTLLEILAGLREANGGQLLRQGRIRVGFLAQEEPCRDDRSVLDEVASGVGPLPEVRDELARVSERLSETVPEAVEYEELIHRRDELAEEYARLGGERTEAEAKRVLAGLGFLEADFGRSTRELSGGERVRLALGRLLVMEPDVLLLDEPTNHLDLRAIEWLETELAAYRGALVVVSHDQTFLDNVVQEILELEAGRITAYHGNYSTYVRERERRQKAAEAVAKRREAEIAKHRQFIQRFGANAAWASQVKSHEKMLERLEKEAAEEVVNVPVRRRPVVFRFPPAAHSGRVVCEVQGITKSYDGQMVVAPLSFVVERGERIALIGPNGAGKSTFLRVLAGLEEPDSGSFQFGPHVVVAYFAQHQADALDLNRTVFTEAAAGAPPNTPDQRIREVLGRMLFRGEMIHAKVGQLSGGERARLALAKLLLIPANLLLLDEPTNHLDIPSKEALEQALSTYEGAIVVATHDRYFLERLETTKLIILDSGEPALVRLGSYEDWRAIRERAVEAERRQHHDTVDEAVATLAVREELDSEIARLEKERDRIAEQLADPQAFKEGDLWGELLEQYQAIDARLGSLLTRRQSFVQEKREQEEAMADGDLASVSS